MIRSNYCFLNESKLLIANEHFIYFSICWAFCLSDATKRLPLRYLNRYYILSRYCLNIQQENSSSQIVSFRESRSRAILFTSFSVNKGRVGGRLDPTAQGKETIFIFCNLISFQGGKAAHSHIHFLSQAEILRFIIIDFSRLIFIFPLFFFWWNLIRTILQSRCSIMRRKLRIDWWQLKVFSNFIIKSFLKGR